jgi:hypothetical protein
MKVAILITVFNEEKNIGDLLNEINGPFDVFVVDDGSSDNTVAIARAGGADVIRLPLNLGQGAATIAGYKLLIEKAYDIIIKMDGDGQHDPRQIPLLLDKLNESDFDIVVGSRILGANYDNAPFFRRTFLPVFTGIINILSGYHLTDAMSGFRAFRVSALKNVLDILDNLIEPQYIASEMFIRFAKAGLSVTEVPIIMRDRKSGSSYKGLVRYGWGVIRAIIRTLIDKQFRET